MAVMKPDQLRQKRTGSIMDMLMTSGVNAMNKALPDGVQIGKKRYSPGIYGGIDKKTGKVKKNLEIDSF